MRNDNLKLHYPLMMIAVLVLTFASSAGFAASYYVNSAGSDSNPGTQAAPWKTVAKVNATSFTPGDNVFFASGGAWNEILYPVSGSSSGYITYGAYGTGNRPLIKSVQCNGKSYINIQGLEIKSNDSNYYAVNIYNYSNHINVSNCTVTNDTSNTSWAAFYIEFSSYCQVSNCTVQRLNLSSQGDAFDLARSSQHNLVQGNTFGSATHYALSLSGSTNVYPTAQCAYNVIRNNIINNPNGAQVEMDSDANFNLVEGNVIENAYNSPYDNNCPRSFKLVNKNNIVRKNIVMNNTQSSGSGISLEEYTYSGYPANYATQNHVYNNIITNVSRYPIVIDTDGSAGATAYNNYFVNNIIFNNNPSSSGTWDYAVQNTSLIYNNYFQNNIVYEGSTSNVILYQGQSVTVAGAQSLDPAHFSGNQQVAPQLDATFHPLAGSPAIDKGAFLTTVTSGSGSGTSFTVADANFFCDGFGITTGDTIMVGSTSATIGSINYGTNTITVTSPISWTQGANVSLPYNGTRPDIGVYEYSATPVVAAPTNLQFLN